MREIIFGTDWWDDCDDVVALRLFCRAHQKGEIKLSGIVVNAVSEYSAPSVDGFLALENVSDVPIGLDFDATDYPMRLSYQKQLARSAKRYRSNSDAEDAVKLYRRVLSDSEEKVDIVEVGFLQALAGLINSEADEISDLNGIELLKENAIRFGLWQENGMNRAVRKIIYVKRCVPLKERRL